MFEQVVIRRHESRGKLIDPGLLAESLLFYERVHLLLDGGCLRGLLTTIGPDVLLNLLDQKRVTATCLTDNLGVFTNQVGPISYHEFTAFTVARDPDGRRVRPQDSITRAFTETLGNTSANRRKIKKIIDYLEFRPHVPVIHRADGTTIDALSTSIPAQTRDDIEDQAYLRRVIEQGLREVVPEYQPPMDWEFELIKTPQGYVHSTNLNFERINRIYHQRVSPNEDSITPASLLGKALNARADLVFAADYMSEFVTDELSSSLMQNRIATVLSRRQRSSQEQQLFQEVVLSDAKALREAINSGERTFDEFLRLLDQARRFRSWLHSRNPDAELLAEYVRATNAESWAGTLPSRIARFIFCTSAAVGCEQLIPGAGGIAAGATIGAADLLLLERLARGWRPNQFIEGPLRAFAGR